MLKRVLHFVGRRLHPRRHQSSDDAPVIYLSLKDKLDAQLDEALRDTFPSSDPVSLCQPSAEPRELAVPEQDPLEH